MSNDLTPYILALLTLLSGAGTWLFKQTIQHGKDLASIRTALSFYFAEKGKGAAVILEASTNPTPDEVKTLLRKYRQRSLDNGEMAKLEIYLRDISRTNAEKFAAAQEMLAILGAQQRLEREMSR